MMTINDIAKKAMWINCFFLEGHFCIWFEISFVGNKVVRDILKTHWHGFSIAIRSRRC